MHSSTLVRSVSTSQTSSVKNALISEPTSRSISPTLYQFLLKPMSDSEVEEFHEYFDQLEEVIPEDSLSKSHYFFTCDYWLKGHNTMLSLLVLQQDQLKVIVANGSWLFTRGLCNGINFHHISVMQLNAEIAGYSEAREREFPLVQEVESKVKELYEMIVSLNSNHISLRISFRNLNEKTRQMDEKVRMLSLLTKALFH
ncbi:hypothetical protein Gotur_033397 [Gossypium turneri]